MKDEQIMEFVKLVVKSIQTNYPSTKDCKKVLTEVLEQADIIADQLTGERIVVRGNKTLIEALADNNNLTRI